MGLPETSRAYVIFGAGLVDDELRISIIMLKSLVHSRHWCSQKFESVPITANRTRWWYLSAYVYLSI